MRILNQMTLSDYISNMSSGPISVSRGRDNVAVNTIRNFSAIPTKIAYLNPNTSSGWVSDKTVNTVVDYLAENGLTDVHVSVNEYDPSMIFSRTFSNPNTSIITKLFFGLPFGILQTLLPAKLLASSDYYDCISNTLHIFSDDPSLALATAAQANAMNDFSTPGWNILAQLVPIIETIYNISIGEQALESAAAYAKRQEALDGTRFSYQSMALRTRLPYVAVATCLDGIVRTILTIPFVSSFRPVVAQLLLGNSEEANNPYMRSLLDNYTMKFLGPFVLLPLGVAITHIISKLESFSWGSKRVSHRKNSRVIYA